MSDKPKMPGLPDAGEFTTTLGQITWLLSQSAAHKALPISEIEPRFMAPLMFKQVRVFLKAKQPLAVLTWAYASPDVAGRIAAGNTAMTLSDWRSGPSPVIVECVSPLVDPAIFITQFTNDVRAAEARGAGRS
jgi:cytolysin-activating lysine-acyltransferase